MRTFFFVVILTLAACGSRNNEPLEKPNFKHKTITQLSAQKEVDEIVGIYKNLNRPGDYFFIDSDQTMFVFTPADQGFRADDRTQYLKKATTTFSYLEGELEITGLEPGSIVKNETTHGKKVPREEVPTLIKPMVSLLQSVSGLDLMVRELGVRVMYKSYVSFDSSRVAYDKIQRVVDMLASEPSTLTTFLLSKKLKGLKVAATIYPKGWEDLAENRIDKSYLHIENSSSLSANEIFLGVKNANLPLE